ncbi:MAG TPA: hypothetical protein VFE47_17855 [Tepidisphaeraceae bacterium]|nr:hypothetical protein [Tepidisphaeraceae bacterium]
MTLGLAIPSFAMAGRAPQRTENRTATHETRTVTTHNARPEIRHDDHVAVRDQHVRVDAHPVIRDEHRDVRVDEHVVVDGRRYWDHDRIGYIPAPVIVTAPVVVAPYTDTPVAINQVPPAVLDAAARQTGGAPIIGVDFVQNAGGTFYDVHVTGAYNTIQTLRFGINGGFYGNV